MHGPKGAANRETGKHLGCVRQPLPMSGVSVSAQEAAEAELGNPGKLL